MRAAGARQLVLYGQFEFVRGAPAGSHDLAELARAALAEPCPEVSVVEVAIGHGVGLDGAIVSLDPE